MAGFPQDQPISPELTLVCTEGRAAGLAVLAAGAARSSSQTFESGLSPWLAVPAYLVVATRQALFQSEVGAACSQPSRRLRARPAGRRRQACGVRALPGSARRAPRGRRGGRWLGIAEVGRAFAGCSVSSAHLPTTWPSPPEDFAPRLWPWFVQPLRREEQGGRRPSAVGSRVGPLDERRP